MDLADHITIAAPTIADRDAVIELLAAQLAEHQIDTPLAAIGAAVDGMLDDEQKGIIRVAKVQADVIGVAYVGFCWTLEHGGKSAWLEELYVRPDRRQHGVGTLLLAASLDAAKSHGCLAVDIDVDRDHSRVVSLYERHGFRSLPRARWMKSL